MSGARVGVLGLGVAGVAIAAWAVMAIGGHAGTSRGHVDGRVSDEGQVPEPSVAVLMEGESLKGMLEVLHQYRREGKAQQAAALRECICDRVRGATRTEEAQDRCALLYGGMRALLHGLCDDPGEALYHEDRGVCATADLSAHPDHQQAALELLLAPVFTAGVPEEHQAYDESSPRLRHAECVAIGTLLGALRCETLSETDVRCLLFSAWTRECPIVRAAVMAAIGSKYNDLMIEALSGWQATSTDRRVVRLLCEALLRGGRVAEALALIDSVVDTDSLAPALQAVAWAGTPEEAMTLLTLVRVHLEQRTDHNVPYQQAMALAYADLCRRSVGDDGPQRFLERIVAALETHPEEWSERGHDALMSGICDGCAAAELKGGKALFPREGSDAYCRVIERLGTIVVAKYEHGTIPTDGLGALARVAVQGSQVLGPASDVVRGGCQAATLDVLLALRKAQSRGLLKDPESTAQAANILVALAERTYGGQERAFMKTVRELRCVGALAALDRMIAQLEVSCREGVPNADALLQYARETAEDLRR